MIRRTRIKVCGITNIEDANAAVQMGVDALGFIFTDKSPRYILPEKAKKIVEELPPFLFKVGVFVDENKQEIEEIVHYLGLNSVQLHGDEDPAFCQNLTLLMPSCSIIKAFRLGSHSKDADFMQYHKAVSGFLLDTYVKGTDGGTGVPFDWNVLKTLNIMFPFIVAGGLNPTNITEALTIATPFGVDVNSGVEHSPGMKDHVKMMRFVEKVVEFDRQAE
jgi:phosphoribosylanthranilate isomerase